MRQWLVLLLRTLVVLLIVCAFARPTYQTGGGWGGATQPVEALILIDLSYSTRYRLPSGTLFSQLQNRLGDLLGVFAERDQVEVMPFARQPQEPFSGDLEYLRERTAELAPNQEATDLRAALHAAADRLRRAPDRDRELFLFTDLAHHNWDQVEDMAQAFAETRVYVIAPQVPTRPNAHIARVDIPSWMLTAGDKTTLRVELGASVALEDATLDLFVEGERRRRQSVDLGPDNTVEVDFSFSPRRAGRLSGHVVLESDGLELDNRRYFAIDLPTTITALLLGDRPDDTYYPRRALGAAALSDPALEVRTGLFANLDDDALKGVDVLVLCNLERLGAAQRALLGDFVAGGGGLVLFPGPRSDLSYYNRDLLPGLIPARFRDLIGDPNARNAYQTLDAEAPYHPLFTRLLSGLEADQPRFYASFSLAPKSNLLPLVRFTDGQLAMALAWKEQGRVALAAFPLDPQWNDLHLRGLFAPLLHRLVRELSLPPHRRTTYQIGETVYRHLDGLGVEEAVEAETPSGNRLRLEPEWVGGRFLWKVPAVREAGIWRLRTAGEIVDLFPVNLDTRESDLEPVPPKSLQRVFGNFHFPHPGDDLRLAVLGNRYGRELWREFLLLALALIALEQWVARAPRQAQPAREAA